ncbi:MAG: [protein-PII] uridylyltransferase [Verrucomicrobiota bacterium]|nr:[protein-PII] uridylyltransferase [Verrucomicrobiota bacterium]
MQELLKKIEEDARVRLTEPPGPGPAGSLARYKAYLKVGTHRLKMSHRSGMGGRDLCRARAAMLDALLRHLWETARRSLSLQAQKEFPPLALAAVGGYGRGELNPHSDIDFMFLHDGQVAANKPLPYLSKLIDGVLYPLWDVGLKVGHAVRSVEDCVKIANSDMQSRTSLIESRLIAGEEALFKKFERTLTARCVDGFEQKYIAARLEDQAARRAKFGNSACMQEPNLKNGCGGLRDFQNLLWMAFFKYRARSLNELQKLEFVAEAERRQLETAYDFLLRVRTELHYHSSRAQDALGKNLQPAVAHNLGYTERSPSLRIEEFMRDLYTHMRNIFLITRTLEQRMALRTPVPGRLSWSRWLPRRAQVVEPVDGLLFANGEIRAVSNRIFRDQPRRLMRVFLHAQQRRLPLHPDLAQLIRNSLGLVDAEFRDDPHVRETLLALLERRGEVAPALRAMHEVNLLGKYIPEFGRLTCLVQHEFYHQYAADEHTLVCLEQLDKIWEAQAPPHNRYAPLLQKLTRPGLLYLALLLHDVGKAQHHKQRRRHSEISARMATRAARRLGLDESASQILHLLVKQHLLMAEVSQRRDLDDDDVIRHFARQIQTVEALNLLTLLTFADAQGTSDQLWNGFKDSLLWQLHGRALALLTGGGEFRRADEKQRELLLQEIRDLAPKHFSDEEIQAHFANLPPRYFQVRSPREILDDIEMAHHFMRQLVLNPDHALSPAVSWRDEPDCGYNVVKVCTWDRAGLFSKICGSFSAAGVNILSARILTRADGVVLDTFFVNDARSGGLAARGQRDQFTDLLEQVLAGTPVALSALIRRQITGRPSYQAYAGERLPTRIHFDNDASETYTVIEIETEDQLGLLYSITQTLAGLAVDIASARILTERGAAIDSFYVRDADGGKITSREHQALIERGLRQAIQTLTAAG